MTTPKAMPTPAATHRGITAEDLPQRDRLRRGLAFAMFTRGLWPPERWRLPVHLQGGELKAWLQVKVREFDKHKGNGTGRERTQGAQNEDEGGIENL